MLGYIASTRVSLLYTDLDFALIQQTTPEHPFFDLYGFWTTMQHALVKP